MSGSVEDLDDFLRQVEKLAGSLVTHERRAYDVGTDMLSLAKSGLGGVDSVAHPLWLLWGSLTDLVDGPQGERPGAEERATALMRRAASEWLATSPADRDQYFERWIYEECGLQPTRGPLKVRVCRRYRVLTSGSAG